MLDPTQEVRRIKTTYTTYEWEVDRMSLKGNGGCCGGWGGIGGGDPERASHTVGLKTYRYYSLY